MKITLKYEFNKGNKFVYHTIVFVNIDFEKHEWCYEAQGATAFSMLGDVIIEMRKRTDLKKLLDWLRSQDDWVRLTTQDSDNPKVKTVDSTYACYGVTK